jgi:AcrR family transcriptional regulator
MKRIATSAGISTVTFYKYFDSKEELLHEVIEFAFKINFAQQSAIIDDDSLDFPTKLTHLMALDDVLSSDTSEEYTRAVRDHARNDKHFEERYAAHYAATFQRIIDQGRAEGYINDSATDRAIRFMIDTLITQGRQNDNPELTEPRFAEEVTNLFFFGLMGAPDTATDLDKYNRLKVTIHRDTQS